MLESTYLQPLLRNRENWKTGNILVLLNPSQKQLDDDFSVFLSRLRDPKLCNVSSLYGDQAITYLQPLLRNRKNWKTGNILVLLNPSQKQLDGDFSVFLSRLRDPKLCSVSFYMETRSSQVS